KASAKKIAQAEAAAKKKADALEEAKAKLDQLTSSGASKKAIAKATAALPKLSRAAALAAHQVEKVSRSNELGPLREKLEAKKRARDDALASSKSAELVAPASGTVSYAAGLAVGQKVEAGAVVARLVDSRKLVVLAQLDLGDREVEVGAPMAL